MLRLITCQQATLLVEQRPDQPLSPTARNSLWLHLRYCPYCHRYARQSALINQLARHPAGAGAEKVKLPADARERLRLKLLAATNR